MRQDRKPTYYIYRTFDDEIPKQDGHQEFMTSKTGWSAQVMASRNLLSHGK